MTPILPALIVVSGPPGVGKTTFAHKLARIVGCPAICRDEIKEGMVHANPGYQPTANDPLNLRTLRTFFDSLQLLLRAGVTVVAESAFQDKLWRPGLEPLLDLCAMRIVHLEADPGVVFERKRRRLEQDPTRMAHADVSALQDEAALAAPSHDWFVPVSLPVPTLTVDTTDGYNPTLQEVAAFVDTVDQR